MPDDDATKDIKSPPDPQPKIFIETFSVNPENQKETEIKIPKKSKPEE